MMNKKILRQQVRDRLHESVEELNKALDGYDLETLEPVLKRISSGQGFPHWYPNLKQEQTLPNLDGKSVGSVIEMLYLAVLETKILRDSDIPELKVNPAKGVDFPDLDLGVKSPSTNYATSEPFFSAYERLLGSEYDCVVLLTNYQSIKKNTSLKLKIVKARYFDNTQLADKQLCQIAREKRDWLLRLGEPEAKKVFRFLAYVNKQDWRARHLLELFNVMPSQQEFSKKLEDIKQHYEKTNKDRIRNEKELIPDYELSCLLALEEITPVHMGVINAMGNWIVETFQDFGRYPNGNEWGRLKTSPLNGEIGMSMALQWRYNFSTVFAEKQDA
ncbi:hypothetical protein QUF72_05565 [Desulfobacterales bacterium HSG2]|nr:hypothetical protein [Desulfobacterales bacterium HSG2]